MRVIMRGVLTVAVAVTLSACGGGGSEPDSAPATTSAATTTTSAATTTKAAAASPELTASQRDQVFIKVIDSYGIDYGGDPAAAIDLGHAICEGLGRGLSQTDLLPSLTGADGPGYSLATATDFINSSIATYCDSEA
ncbi:DUF732 domain-containing protein [Promicromonospora sukumoe]